MRKYNYRFNPLLAIFTCFLIMSCANTPDVVGKWREVGKTATLEFFKDPALCPLHVFNLVNNAPKAYFCQE